MKQSLYNSLIIRMQNELQQYHFNLGQNLDVKDTTNKWVNAEIIYIKDNHLYVHYSGWSTKYDQCISIHSDRILTQWDYQQDIQINNRVDGYHPLTGWLEARVIDKQQSINPHSGQKELKRVKIHYFNYHSKYDRWIDPFNRKQMDIIGSQTKAYGIGKSRWKRKGQVLTLSELAKKILQIKKRNMIQELKNKNFMVKDIDGDGNCLFRSVSDQLYGTQQYHSQIRNLCMNYIQKEKQFFQDFVTQDIENYVKRKLNNGVWGDDIQIQAISEIYSRPIEIYATSSKPLRTFHEDSSALIEPLRLAYVGRCHYNSIKRADGQNKGILGTQFGQYQQIFILGYENRTDDSSINKYRGFFSRTNGIEDALYENVEAGQNKEQLNQKILEIQTKQIKQAMNISQTQNILQQIQKSQLREINNREEQLMIQQQLIKLEQRQLALAQELSKKLKPERPYWFFDLMGLGFGQQQILFAIEINGYDAEKVQNFLLDNM